MSALGKCDQCKNGDLCVRGDTIECESCGFPHPNHPLVIEFRNRPKPKPDDFQVTSDAMVSNWPTLPQLTETVRKLTARVHALEAMNQPQKVKRSA